MNNDQDFEQLKIDQEINWRKKDFALVLDASNFILKAKGFRIQRIRAVIDALQGVAGGREEFECSHLNLARRLDVGNEKEVTDEAKMRRVQRLLAVLEAEQNRVGRKAFSIIRGGGFEHKKTRYIDNLTELAALAVSQMQQRMKEENINPSRFKIILEEEAIKNSDYLPDVVKKNADEKKTIPLENDLYIQRVCNHSAKNFRCGLKRWLENGGDEESFLQRYQEMQRLAAELIKIEEDLYIQKVCNDSVNDFSRGLNRWLKIGGDKESFIQNQQDRHRREAESLKIEILKEAEENASELSEAVINPFSDENDAEAQETAETADLQNDSNQSNEPNMMQEAMDLARKGFRVFPVYEPTSKGCSCRQGEKCTNNAGKHPRVMEWQKAATTDEKQIKTWWSKWNRANIGIATGKGSNIIVLDVDANKGGDASVVELFADTDLPETLTAQTGNGYHIFFQIVEGFEIKNSVVKIGDGLDIRGENGFVVASPSLHRTGKRYAWTNKAKPCPLPENLKEKLIEIERQKTSQVVDSKEVKQTKQSEFSKQSKMDLSKAIPSLIPEGMRNETLFRRVAAPLSGKGASEYQILVKLREVNITHCIPQLEDSELQKIARSAVNIESRNRAIKQNVSTSVY